MRITSPDPQERIDAMLAAWRERCPISLALRNANGVALDLRLPAEPASGVVSLRPARAFDPCVPGTRGDAD